MIRQLLLNIESKLGEYNELDGRMKYVGICALFCLHFQLYRMDDKRQFRMIWDVYRKVKPIPKLDDRFSNRLQIPIVHLYGNVSWIPCKFLLEKVPALARSLDKKTFQAAEQYRPQYLSTKESSLTK